MRLRTDFLSSRFARRLFIVFILSAALPIATLATLTFRSVSDQLLDQNRVQQQRATKSLGMSIFEQLVLMDTELRLVGYRLPQSLHNELMVPKFQLDNRLSEKFIGIWLQPITGGTIPILGKQTNLGAAQLHALDLSKGATLFTKSDGAGKSRIYMARVVSESTHSNDVVIGEINPNYLWGVEKFEADKNICVIGHDHSLLFCYQDTPMELSQSILEITRDSFSGYTEWISEEHPNQLVSYWSMFLDGPFSVDDWVVLVSVPRSVVLQPVTNFQKSFLIVFSITMLMVLVLSSFQIRRILTPLRKLTAGIQAIGNTNFNSRVEINSNDEFSELASSFNTMGRKLSDQFKSLETMAEIDRLILASQDAQNVVQIVLARIQDIVGCDCVGIATQDKEGNFSKISVRSTAPNGTSEEKETNIQITKSNRAFFEKHDEGTVVAVDQKSPSFLGPLASLGARECLVLPLYIDGALIAVVALGYKTVPSNPEQQVLETKRWTDRVSVALSNARWQEKLFNQANYDALTGLPNRPAFQCFLEKALSRASRSNEVVAVLFIDLDRFKLVNDSLGREVGDEYLNLVGARLSECIRSTDMLARLGGDEFAVVTAARPNHDQINTSISIVADKLLSAIAQPANLRGQEVHTNASIGVSVYPLDANSIEDLMKNADAAMYQAKALDGGNYHYYSEEMNQIVGEQLRLESEVRMAVLRDEFELYYQPLVETETGKILGAEALLRLNHSNGEIVTPETFIPMAEQSMLIVEIDKWVIDAACAQIRNWREENLPEIRIAVNLSARFFRLSGVIDILQTITSQYGVEPRLLELQITEDTVIDDIDSAISVLKELNELGYQLTIDDFGVGYSSLTYLKKLPMHKLKIDKSCVENCSQDNADGSLVKTIINMAKTLGLVCIAEGVETEEQLEFLKESGCDEVQGYYYSCPISEDEFTSTYLSKNEE